MRRLANGNVAHGCETCDGEDACTCKAVTVARAQAELRDAERQIQQIIRQFERFTGLTVKEVNLRRVFCMGIPDEMQVEMKAEVMR